MVYCETLELKLRVPIKLSKTDVNISEFSPKESSSKYFFHDQQRPNRVFVEMLIIEASLNDYSPAENNGLSAS